MKKVFGKIYKIYNDINNKIYIGKTTGKIEDRFKKHKRTAKYFDYKKNRSKLYSAIRKYGEKHFYIVEIDEAFSLKELNAKEVYWIKHLDSINKGYNIAKGGDGGNVIGTLSKDDKFKIYQKRNETNKRKSQEELDDIQKRIIAHTDKKKRLKTFKNTYKIKEKEKLTYRIDLILNSNIDFSKNTWFFDLQKLLSMNRNYLYNFIKININFFKKLNITGEVKFFKSKRTSRYIDKFYNIKYFLNILVPKGFKKFAHKSKNNKRIGYTNGNKTIYLTKNDKIPKGFRRGITCNRGTTYKEYWNSPDGKEAKRRGAETAKINLNNKRITTLKNSTINIREVGWKEKIMKLLNFKTYSTLLRFISYNENYFKNAIKYRKYKNKYINLS